MYKLYYKAGACSMAVHVLLNELGVKFELENAFDSEGRKTRDFLAAAPRGQVPTLIVDGTPVVEGGAILTYLLDAHESALLPRGGIERATALQWLMWCNASLHPAYGRFFWLKGQDIDDTAKKTLMKNIQESIQSFWDQAEKRLGETRYLAGDQFGAADILMTVIANWNIGHQFNYGPNLQRVLKEISGRPAYRQALAAENIEYKAVA